VQFLVVEKNFDEARIRSNAEKLVCVRCRVT
jgi:hypothetical protein